MSLQRLALKVKSWTKAESSHEQLMWWYIRVLCWRWWHIRRQYKVSECRLDIAIVDIKLAVEIDGLHWHLKDDRPERDAKRTKFLMSRGWKVLRIPDWEIELAPWVCALRVRGVVNKLRAKKK